MLGNVYPVVDGDMKDLIGKSNYQNYDSHYVPVIPQHPNNPNEVNYYPCKPTEAPIYDEFVVFQENQLLPLCAVYYELNTAKGNHIHGKR